MTQKRFLSPFSCCAVSFLARNWYMPDCTLWFSRFISFLSTTRVQKVRLTMVFRFELSSDQEIEVQNRFLRSKVFWLWVNGRILRVCTLEFRIFQVKSLTIVLKSLPNAKIPNKISISIPIDLSPDDHGPRLKLYRTRPAPFLRETIVKFRFKSDSVNFYGFCYIRRMKIFKVPTIWFDNVNNIKFKQEKLTGSVFLGLLNAASSCPIIFCLHVR